MTAKKKRRVPEKVARPTRTAVQGTPAFLIVWMIDENFWNMNDQTFGVMVLLLTGLFSFLQTAYEDAKKVGFMREVPPTTVPPVT